MESSELQGEQATPLIQLQEFGTKQNNQPSINNICSFNTQQVLLSQKIHCAKGEFGATQNMALSNSQRQQTPISTETKIEGFKNMLQEKVGKMSSQSPTRGMSERGILSQSNCGILASNMSHKYDPGNHSKHDGKYQQHSKPKKRKMSLFQTVKWLKFVQKWISITSFSRFKQLSYFHFQLINDKAVILDPKNLPNRNQRKRITNESFISGETQQLKTGLYSIKQRLQFWNILGTGQSSTGQNEEDQIGCFIKFQEAFQNTFLKSCDSWLSFIPVFSPSGTFKFLWDLAILSVIISFIFMIPLELTFSLTLKEMFNNQFLIFCNAILLSDVCLAWNFGYFEKGLPITKRSRVILNYLKNGLLTDITACSFLSFDIIFSYNSNFTQYLHLLFFFKFKSIKLIFKKIEERFHLTPKITQISSLVQLLFIILTVAHFLGCMWVAVAHAEINSGQNAWILKVAYDSSDWFAQYICAYYFATVTMITVGYGDFAPANNTERVVNICSMLISCGVFAYSINAIGEIFTSINMKKKQIKEDLFLIGNFMSKKNVSQELQYEVREFLEYQWGMANEGDHEKENQLLNQLNPQLKEKLLIETYKMVISQYPIFYENFSEEFMISIIDIIEENSFRPEQLVSCQISEQQNDLFFIQSGNIIIYSDEDAEKIVKTFRKGEVFGEIGFFSGQTHALNIKATEYSTVLRVQRKRFIQLIQTFPVDYEIFCHIQDKLLFQHDYSIINISCFICNSSAHTFKACPSIHLTLNQFQVVNKMNRDQICQRKPIVRQHSKFPSFILNEEVKDMMKRFWREDQEEIFVYGEQYLENNEDMYGADHNYASEEDDDEQQQQIQPDIQKSEMSPDLSNANELGSSIKEIRISPKAMTPRTHIPDSQTQQQEIISFRGQNQESNFLTDNKAKHLKLSSEIDLALDSPIKSKSISLLPSNLISYFNQRSNSMTSNRQPISPFFKKDRGTVSSLPLASNQLKNDKSPNILAVKNNRNSEVPNLFSLPPRLISPYQIANSDGDSIVERQNPQQTGKGLGPLSQLNNPAKVKLFFDELIKVMHDHHEQEIRHTIAIPQGEEEFDKQKNYEYYLPHNNLSTILDYIRFRQKRIKLMRQSGRPFVSQRENTLLDLFYDDATQSLRKLQSQGNVELFGNRQNHQLIRRFQQSSSSKRESLLIRKRQEHKMPTSHIQQLAFKYEQISNQQQINGNGQISPDEEGEKHELPTPDNDPLRAKMNTFEKAVLRHGSKQTLIFPLGQNTHNTTHHDETQFTQNDLFMHPDNCQHVSEAIEEVHKKKTFANLQKYLQNKNNLSHSNSHSKLEIQDYSPNKIKDKPFLKSIIELNQSQPIENSYILKTLNNHEDISSLQSTPVSSRQIQPPLSILPNILGPNLHYQENSSFLKDSNRSIISIKPSKEVAEIIADDSCSILNQFTSKHSSRKEE